MSKTTRTRLFAGAAVTAAGALALSACGSGDAVNDASDGLLMWTLEVQPDRLEAQQAVLDEFTSQTDIEVELVPVEQDQVAQLMASAALSEEMPDVVGAATLGLVRSFESEGYLNHDIAADVVDALGADSFTEASLDLTRDGDAQLAVPADAWAQILVYRQDLFEEAGLEAPTTYESLRTAAETLTSGDSFGITLATDPAGTFTQETFESLALGNDCQLVDDGGDVTLDSEACTSAVDLYTTLGADLSPAGTQTVESTRASYFSGQSAMILWSTFVLDELAGLRADAAPACDECSSGTWLAENSGIVPLVTGPDGGENAGSFGEITSFAASSAASPDETAQLIEFLMTDGYVDWLAMAPEGKMPVRHGQSADSTEYLDAWTELETGVDTRMPLGDIYSEETISALLDVTENISRWALTQGQGDIIGPLNAQLPIAKVVADSTAGSVDAATAQRDMVDAVTDIAE
ncbi:ABC transporter substrate-binding protein [Demequina sp. SO4-18]|uniref:ABC transporter substrate-binding protein n=1 Tax=Demequina sp. SO4-18 TaxID=3401026 RepID=UPI003B5ADDA5